MRMVSCLCSALVLLLGLMACVNPSAGTALIGPLDIAEAFYRDLRRQAVSGLPSAEVWARLRPRLTPELAAAFEAARVEQAAFRRAHPQEKPPWVDGDLFSSLFEGPQAFRLGDALTREDRSEVAVHCVYGEGAGATQWTDVLLLRRTASGWRVDDLRYGGTWDFALRGSLRQMLAAGAQ
jgi:hypothetical protein